MQTIHLLILTHIHWIKPLLLIISGFIAIFIFEKIILLRLKTVSKKSPWKGDSLVIRALSGKTWIWCGLLGLYGIMRTVPMDAELSLFFHKVLAISMIGTLVFIASNIAGGLIRLYTQQIETHLPSVSIFATLSKIFIIVIGILIILQYLGISITPILTALGVGGLAVALALQDTLSNLFAGLNIILSKQIRPGDYIKLDMGEEGYVADITWRNTTIRQQPNTMVVIPNNKLSAAIITNYYQPNKQMSVKLPLSVGYDSDLDKVEAVTIQTVQSVLKEIKGGIQTVNPLVRFQQFGDSGIHLSIIFDVAEITDQHLIKHELIKRLLIRYRDEGIQIPYPMRRVLLTRD